jgi:NAD-dependent SIR2 family protein deacetylase
MGLALKADRGAFVVTTNVDGHFQRAGFPAEQIWEMHGSIHQLQCLEPCVQDLWPAWSVEPEVDTERVPLPGRGAEMPGLRWRRATEHSDVQRLVMGVRSCR